MSHPYDTVHNSYEKYSLKQVSLKTGFKDLERGSLSDMLR